MKITERRLRQLIRQVIKENSGSGAIIAGIAIYIGIQLTAIAALGLKDLYHIVRDNVMGEYCEMTGGTDPMLSPEEFELFLKEGITISVGQVHGGEVLILESSQTGTKIVVALEDTGGMRRPSNQRRFIADIIGRAISGDPMFDASELIVGRRKGRSYVTQSSSQYDPDLVKLIQHIYGRHHVFSDDMTFNVGNNMSDDVGPGMSNESYSRRKRVIRKFRG